jgi:phosphohistidine phosphatase
LKLLVIRHARADAPRSDVPDGDRALTRDGAARFELSARGLARLVDAPAVLLTSPLLRARQTAALCAAAWRGPEATVEIALASGSVDAILDALAEQSHDASVALIGHEPTVSGLVTELLSARGETIPFGVGTAALLEVSSLPRRAAHLIWFLPAPVTEALGRG